AFGVRRLALGAWRSAFGVWRHDPTQTSAGIGGGWLIAAECMVSTRTGEDFFSGRCGRNADLSKGDFDDSAVSTHNR
ncbi:MAG TPA: hypothetical protein VHY59_10625, partial [Chthoniobacterales bacterium]|nr:hypothetical protein [Chthoniobacterales bacterium]